MYFPNTVCLDNLKSCDPLLFHFSFPLLDVFIFLSSHTMLHMDCQYALNLFPFSFFFLLHNFCSCLKANSFHLNLFISSQRFLMPNLLFSYSLFFFLFCFILKFPDLSFLQTKKVDLLVLGCASLNGG